MQPGILTRFTRPAKDAPLEAGLHAAIYDLLNAGTRPHGADPRAGEEVLIRITGIADGTLASSIAGDSPPTGYVPSAAPFYKWVQVQWDPVNSVYKDLPADTTSTLDNSMGLNYMALGFAMPVSGQPAAVGSIVRARQMTIQGLAPFMLFEGGLAALYRVSGNTVITADRKWKYSLTPQKEGTATLGGTSPRWIDDTAGTVLTTCLNILEDQNDSGNDLQGNDMDLGAAPFGSTSGTVEQKLKAIQNKRLVTIERTSTTTDGTPVTWYWFRAANLNTGICNP